MALTLAEEILKHQNKASMNHIDDFSHGTIEHALALYPTDVDTPTFDNAETVFFTPS